METIRIERITDPLTTGNCYILLENGHAVIIDPNDEDRIEEVLRQYEAEPDYVLLTHEHADSTGCGSITGSRQWLLFHAADGYRISEAISREFSGYI